jgi:3-oxocholest-4-en-26-oyl-CoA dehydrogenase alpha subunit
MTAVPNVGALEFNEDQLALLASVDGVCSKFCAPGVVANQDELGAGLLWKALAEIGVLGLGTPEGGGTIADAAAVMLRLGEAWAPGPLIATLAVAPALSADLRAQVAAGSRRVALGTGGRFHGAAPDAIFVELAAGALRLVHGREVKRLTSRLSDEWSIVSTSPAGDLPGFDQVVGRLDVFLAAYLVGACDRMIRVAAAYAAERVQFGRPIGSNQAVSHALAQCLTGAFAAEGLVRVAAGRLARTGAEGADTAAARVAATTLTQRVCRMVPQTFGAIGLSVEGPISAMIQRLPMLTLLPPSLDEARERIATAVFDGDRVCALALDLALPSEVVSFLAEVAEFANERRWVRGYVRDETTRGAVKQVCRELGQRGWLSLCWPLEHGGAGKSLLHEFVLWNELAYAEVTRPPTGMGVVAKVLIEHGTEMQQREFLPRLRAGEIDIALGYSEPEAGSDLTSLRTRARRDGDGYIVNGEKRWTSNGHVADFLWLLCRTGTTESRAKGLSAMLVDLPSPGITVQPIYMLDGARLNEIHFADVYVPVSRRVGEENRAWEMISHALSVERYVNMPPKKCVADLEKLAGWLRDNGRDQDALVRARIADLAVEVATVEVAAYGAVLSQEHALPAAVPATHAKLLHSVTTQRMADAALELGGPELIDATDIQAMWLQALGETIGGGTTEILRTSIAKVELRLPVSF